MPNLDLQELLKYVQTEPQPEIEQSQIPEMPQPDMGFFGQQAQIGPQERAQQHWQQFLEDNYGYKKGASKKDRIVSSVGMGLGEFNKALTAQKTGQQYQNPYDQAQKLGRQDFEKLLPYISREDVAQRNNEAANQRALLADQRRKETQAELNRKNRQEEGFKKINAAFEIEKSDIERMKANGQLTTAEATARLTESKTRQLDMMTGFQKQLGIAGLMKNNEMQSAAVLDTMKTGEAPDAAATEKTGLNIIDHMHPQRSYRGQGGSRLFAGAKPFVNPETGETSLLTNDGQVIPQSAIKGLEGMRFGTQGEGERATQKEEANVGNRITRIAELVTNPAVAIGPMQGRVSSFTEKFMGPNKGIESLGGLGKVNAETIEFKQIGRTLVDDFAREKSGAAIPDKEWERLRGMMPDENAPREVAALKIANVLEARLGIDKKFNGAAFYRGKKLEDIQNTINTLRAFAITADPKSPMKAGGLKSSTSTNKVYNPKTKKFETESSGSLTAEDIDAELARRAASAKGSK